VNSYTLELMDDQLLNPIPFIAFCRTNEGRDITVIVNQESHCLKSCGVYAILDIFQFKSVTIETRNAVEEHEKYQIINDGWDWWLNTERTSKFNYSSDYSWDQSKIFGCFYARPNAPRLGIAGYLNNKYPDQSLFKIKFNKSDEDIRKHFELAKIFSWDPNSLDTIDQLLKSVIPSTDDAYNYTTGQYDYGHALHQSYQHIFVDIISEAVNQGRSFYPTEKFARAVLCKKPFIVMSTPFYLRYLKQIGFRTFNRFWSEDYDDLGMNNRYWSILKLIDHLASLSIEQLTELIEQLRPIVEHNYQLLINEGYAMLKLSQDLSLTMNKPIYYLITKKVLRKTLILQGIPCIITMNSHL